MNIISGVSTKETTILKENAELGASYTIEHYGQLVKVFKHDVHPSTSILAGKARKRFVEDFASEEAALLAYPTAEIATHPSPVADHKPHVVDEDLDFDSLDNDDLFADPERDFINSEDDDLMIGGVDDSFDDDLFADLDSHHHAAMDALSNYQFRMNENSGSREVKIYNILWDTDEDEHEELSLPSSLTTTIPDDAADDEEIEDYLRNYLSDEYGFTIFGFQYEIIKELNEGWEEPTRHRDETWNIWENEGTYYAQKYINGHSSTRASTFGTEGEAISFVKNENPKARISIR